MSRSRYQRFNKLPIKTMYITWEILDNVLIQTYQLQKNSVDGGIIIHQLGEKCPG